MPPYVALLRGINVGGKAKVAMADLRSLCEGLGHEGVTTYIQSGNVVFTASERSAAKVADALAKAIESELGLDVTVVVRTPKQLESIVAKNPFADRVDEVKTMAVGFLADKPAAAAVKKLDPDRSPPDEFEVAGDNIYLLYPNGLGRSKLSNDYLERQLGTRATVRNWNTVNKLLELAKDR
jgi:uncharacterized protein (DUF1697 family)